MPQHSPDLLHLRGPHLYRLGEGVADQDGRVNPFGKDWGYQHCNGHGFGDQC